MYVGNKENILYNKIKKKTPREHGTNIYRSIRNEHISVTNQFLRLEESIIVLKSISCNATTIPTTYIKVFRIKLKLAQYFECFFFMFRSLDDACCCFYLVVVRKVRYISYSVDALCVSSFIYFFSFFYLNFFFAMRSCLSVIIIYTLFIYFYFFVNFTSYLFIYDSGKKKLKSQF